MKTVSNQTSKATNTEWNDVPRFYLNGENNVQLGIFTLTPSSSARWDVLTDKVLELLQSNFMVEETENGKIVVKTNKAVLALINGKNVNIEALQEAFHKNEVNFTKVNTINNIIDDMLASI